MTGHRVRLVLAVLLAAVMTTSLGILPGSFVYCYLGTELRTVNATRDLVSARIVVGLLLIALLALAPVLRHHFGEKKKPAP